VEENSNTQRTPYLFTAKELDEETGLYYFGARYYDPRTSVWQSGDLALEDYLPMGRQVFEPQLPGMGGIYNSRNLGMYSYGHQNPVTYSDPDGRSASAFFEELGRNAQALPAGRAVRAAWLLGSAAVAGYLGSQVMQSSQQGGEGGGKNPDMTEEGVPLPPAPVAASPALPPPEDPNHQDPNRQKQGEQARSLDDPQSLRGADPKEVERLIPRDWVKSSTSGKGGVRYANPQARGEQVRVMPGKPGDPNPVKQGPYVRISRGGVKSDPIPLKGNPTLPE
jgi:RHS repeat-associated protein